MSNAVWERVIAGNTPVEMLDNGTLKTVGYREGEVFRWRIADKSQRLRLLDGLAKDVHIIERCEREGVTTLEVWDFTDGTVYSIGLASFINQATFILIGAGHQYAVPRSKWAMRRFTEPAEQGQMRLDTLR